MINTFVLIFDTYILNNENIWYLTIKDKINIKF